MLKKNGGITLIALVITIIVLLILAGVSIAMLTGENGLLTKTSVAADKEKLAGAKDAVTTDVAAIVADWYEDKYVNNADLTASDKSAYIAGKLSYTGTVQGCYVDVTGTKVTVSLVAKTSLATGDTYAEGTINADGTISWEWKTQA